MPHEHQQRVERGRPPRGRSTPRVRRRRGGGDVSEEAATATPTVQRRRGSASASWSRGRGYRLRPGRQYWRRWLSRLTSVRCAALVPRPQPVRGRASRSATPSTTGPATSARPTSPTCFIGTPLALLGMVLFGLVVRWVLHRVVDRIVRRAEEGVLPDRLTGWPSAAVEDGGSAGARRVSGPSDGRLLKSVITGVVIGGRRHDDARELGFNDRARSSPAPASSASRSASARRPRQGLPRPASS